MGDPFANFQLDTLPNQLTKDVVQHFLFVFDNPDSAIAKLGPSDREQFLKAKPNGKKEMGAMLVARRLINPDKNIGAWPLVHLLRKRIEEDPGSACLVDILQTCEDYNEMEGIAEC